MTSRQLDEEAIFQVARNIEKLDTRYQYLDQICGGDLSLRQRVEALLEVHDGATGFLKSNPPLAPTQDQPPMAESAGQEIGRYKLLQQIGSMLTAFFCVHFSTDDFSAENIFEQI